MTKDVSVDYLEGLVADAHALAAEDPAMWGDPADYIPELAHIDPAQLAISVALEEGHVLSAGVDLYVPP